MQNFYWSFIVLVVWRSMWVNCVMDDSSRFYIQAHKFNGFVLDLERQNRCPKHAFVVMSPMRNRSSQHWEIYQGNMIRNVQSGHVLDVAGHKAGGDGYIVMLPAVGRKEQQWALTKKNHIRNPDGKCLQVLGSKNYTGAKLTTYNCEPRANQFFRFVPVK